jgi:hypothetical protein
MAPNLWMGDPGSPDSGEAEEIYEKVRELIWNESFEQVISLREALKLGAHSRFADEEDKAIRYLLSKDVDTLAQAYVYLMGVLIERELREDTTRE